MDNLAHALTASMIGSAVAPQLAKKAPVRFCLVSALIVNIPDLDFFLNFISAEYYHFHHRGFTHSVFGALLFIPLSFFVYSKVMAEVSPENGFGSAKKLWFLSAVQIVFGHYLLDYLTAYGTMFLYPASMQRFSMPLMFIVDPIFWCIGIIGLTAIMYTSFRSEQSPRRVAVAGLLGIAVWWSTLYSYKEESKNLMRLASPNGEVIESYPGPGAPLLWVTLAREGERYFQLATPFFTGAANTPAWQGDQQHYNELCPSLANDATAVASFGEFMRWAEYAVCSQRNSTECVCSGLKYAFLKWPDDTSFGRFSFEPGQGGRFLPPDLSSTYIGHIRELVGL